MRVVIAQCRWATQISLVAAATLLTVVNATAQSEAGVTGSRPGWLPRSVEIRGGITAAQRAEAVARLERIERIVQQVPALANPQGFEILPAFYGGARRLGPGDIENHKYVIEYELTLTFFVPTNAIAHEGCVCIRVRVNPVVVPGEGGIKDEQGRGVWVETQRGESIPGATQVYEGFSPTEPGAVFVLLTPGKAMPWRAATREEYYRAWILETEGKNGSKLADSRALLAKTPYRIWLDGAAERKQAREDALRGMAAVQPAAEVARLRKTLEETEREVTERLSASDSTDQDNYKVALAALNGRTTALRAQLDSMTVDERRMPALIEMSLSEGGPLTPGFRMTDRDVPGVLRVLMTDYDYWRGRRSPVEPRGLLVEVGAGGSGLSPPVHRALWQAFTTMDWAALYKLLEVPR